MKSISTSFVTLACLSLLLASQNVSAKPSKPVEGCLRTEIVPSDNSILTCIDFANKHGTTFEKMLLWNEGLHKNCDNLDVGNPICVEGPPTVVKPAPATEEAVANTKSETASTRPLYPNLAKSPKAGTTTTTTEAKAEEQKVKAASDAKMKEQKAKAAAEAKADKQQAQATTEDDSPADRILGRIL
ncbi:hypothetical protein BG011_009077 [Mortierella polycephala]|uniref:LysM domain-containing protein n=1 Tax=Mortierella polycephala TaxID=41804 RepID=A0A9P6QDK4_9FUNG|nr:hypothetical protein BG011_009077 [Mortierella polycephala]